MKYLILAVSIILMTTACTSTSKSLPYKAKVNLTKGDFQCRDDRQVAWCEGHNRNRMESECVDRRELENVILSPAYMGMGIF